MDKDITTLLREIKSATDWSEPRIAAELGTSQPTVNRILKGQRDCKGATLRAIVDLHSRVCPSDVPARRASDLKPDAVSGPSHSSGSSSPSS